MAGWGQGGFRVLACATLLLHGRAGEETARADDAGEAARSFTPAQVRFYEVEVRPILKARCLKCHGDGPKVRAGFRLDSRAGVLRGGELGPAVSLSQPEQSRLLAAIRYEDLEMPPAGKLAA